MRMNDIENGSCVRLAVSGHEDTETLIEGEADWNDEDSFNVILDIGGVLVERKNIQEVLKTKDGFLVILLDSFLRLSPSLVTDEVASKFEVLR